MFSLLCADGKKNAGGLDGGGLGWVWAAEGGLAGFDQAQDSFV